MLGALGSNMTNGAHVLAETVLHQQLRYLCEPCLVSEHHHGHSSVMAIALSDIEVSPKQITGMSFRSAHPLAFANTIFSGDMFEVMRRTTHIEPYADWFVRLSQLLFCE